MDLDEYALTEPQRTLKRLGVTHVWREAAPMIQDVAAPEAASSAPVPAAPAQAPPVMEASAMAPAQRSAQDPPRPRAQASSKGAESRRDAQLPPILRSLFHGKQSPVRTLWTYAGMYADMQHPAAPPRLDLFRKIQASVRSHLGWPEGDICSWPLDISPEIFVQGVRFFCPVIIIGFGPGLSLPETGAPDADLLRRCALHVLPSLDDMIGGDKQSKNEAWQILQSLRP